MAQGPVAPAQPARPGAGQLAEVEVEGHLRCAVRDLDLAHQDFFAGGGGGDQGQAAGRQPLDRVDAVVAAAGAPFRGGADGPELEVGAAAVRQPQDLPPRRAAARSEGPFETLQPRFDRQPSRGSKTKPSLASTTRYWPFDAGEANAAVRFALAFIADLAQQENLRSGDGRSVAVHHLRL